jgi:hypothetical protein
MNTTCENCDNNVDDKCEIEFRSKHSDNAESICPWFFWKIWNDEDSRIEKENR